MLTYTIGSNGSSAERSHLHSAMKEVFGHNWDITPVGTSKFHMLLKSVSFGRMNLSCAALSQAQLTNTAKLASDAPDPAYNIYLSNRRQILVMDKRMVVLEAGDVTVTDGASALTITTKEPYSTIGLTVPASLLRRYIPDPEKIVGVRFSGKTGFSKIVSCMLLAMWEHAEAHNFDAIGAELANNLLAILATCCQMRGTDKEAPPSDLLAKQEKMKQVIDQNLHRPDLCVGELAKQFGYSIRYVQRLFSQEDCTVSSYIRSRRLQGCQRQLADSSLRHHSITAIAFNWGFNSSAHFSRVFMQEYGISAREYRKQALKGPAAPRTLRVHL
ncbi:MAG: helix-turn-helix domain-containing protein [Gammaproteobacteria bacterium]